MCCVCCNHYPLSSISPIAPAAAPNTLAAEVLLPCLALGELPTGAVIGPARIVTLAVAAAPNTFAAVFLSPGAPVGGLPTGAVVPAVGGNIPPTLLGIAFPVISGVVSY